MRRGSCSPEAPGWRRSSCGLPTPPSASCAGGRAGRTSPTRALLRMVSTLVGLELERSRSPEWATEEAAGDFVRALLDRKITDRGDIEARAAELGTDLAGGAGVLIGRARCLTWRRPGEWRSRVLAIALRAVRAVSSRGARRRGEPGGRGRRGRRGRAGRRTRSGSPAPRTRSPTSSRRASPASRSSVSRSRVAADSGRPLPRRRRRRCWPRTSARPRARGCSPSRTPAPTGCSCRR